MKEFKAIHLYELITELNIHEKWIIGGYMTNVIVALNDSELIIRYQIKQFNRLCTETSIKFDCENFKF